MAHNLEDHFFGEADSITDLVDVSADLNKLAEKASELRMLPEVALKIIQLAQDPETSARELEEVIKNDISISSRILKISNSSFYGLSKKVKNLRHAIMVLGFNAIRNIALSTSLMDLFKTDDDMAGVLWEHSVATAVMARLLALEFADISPDDAFIGGMLHDVGKFILLQEDPKRYRKAFEVAVTHWTFKEEEQKEFGFDHGAIGALVVHRWNLSEDLTKVIYFHHRMSSLYGGRFSPLLQWLIAIVQLANEFTRNIVEGNIPEDLVVDPSDCEANRVLQIPPDRIQGLWADFRLQFFEAKSILLG